MTDKRNKEFIRRHIGPSSEEQKKMLSYLGYDSLDAVSYTHLTLPTTWLV